MKTVKATSKQAAAAARNVAKAAKANTKPSLVPQQDGTVVEVVRKAMAPLKEARKHYTKTREGTGKDRKTRIDNGDLLAQTLRPFKPEEIRAVALALLDVPVDVVAKDKTWNPGQVRMNYGNRIRNAVKKGTVTLEAVEAFLKGQRGEPAPVKGKKAKKEPAKAKPAYTLPCTKEELATEVKLILMGKTRDERKAIRTALAA